MQETTRRYFVTLVLGGVRRRIEACYSAATCRQSHNVVFGGDSKGLR